MVTFNVTFVGTAAEQPVPARVARSFRASDPRDAVHALLDHIYREGGPAMTIADVFSVTDGERVTVASILAEGHDLIVGVVVVERA